MDSYNARQNVNPDFDHICKNQQKTKLYENQASRLKKLEFILKLKISAMIGCLRTRVQKQPIIALSFEFETYFSFITSVQGRVAQSATCLTTDSGVVRPLLSWRLVMNDFYSHSPPFHGFKKGYYLLQAKICEQSTGKLGCLVKIGQKKRELWLD